ncbi:MAG TPA: hypothetical protein VE505_05290 [Vicinamibacterales bacterium]|nr:hypothetical protein [Vicinamibacterales bacterium]
MAARTCIVTVTDLRGIRQSVEVTAETVFEAAARASQLSGGTPGSMASGRRLAWTFRCRNPRSRTR